MVLHRVLCRAVVALLATLAGCGPVGSPDDPRAGVWSYRDFKTDANACNIDSNLIKGGDFTVTRPSPGVLNVDPEEAAPYTCMLEGPSFQCPDHVGAAITYANLGYDAVGTARGTASGTFSDSVHVSGTQNAVVTCAGKNCADAEAFLGGKFPCSLSVKYSAEWKSP
jgi:hypothetical protein